MDEQEIQRRIRATTFPGEPAPKFIVGSNSYSIMDKGA